jgi:uncharacterized protein (TIGR03118 family)
MEMKIFIRSSTRMFRGFVFCILALASSRVGADPGLSAETSYGPGPAPQPPNAGYTVNSFVSDLPHLALHLDTRLVDPWGIVLLNGLLVVADNGPGLVTTYGPGNGSPERTSVLVPPPAGSPGPAAPSGLALNPTKDFLIGHGAHKTPAQYFIVTEDGTVSGWNSASGTNAVLLIDHSSSNAVYKGVAVALAPAGPALYVANFRSNLIEVYDTNFAFVTSFGDPALTALGYAPFNIRLFQDKLVVAFAEQDSQDHDDVPGAGFGYVDIFNLDGTLVRSFAAQGALNAPWGLAIAPLHFGKFSQALLIGNFGDGWINAYNLLTGEYLGPLADKDGNPISLPGLWGLTFNVDPPVNDLEYTATTLYFTVGLNGENDGLLGSIKPLDPLFPPVH